jgi:hypothetical protein
MKDREAKQVLSGSGGFQWERREQKGRVMEGKYGECILYSYKKIETC